MPKGKLTVENKTKWDTRGLTSVILACEKFLDLVHSRTVTIVHTRNRRGISGYAYYPPGGKSVSPYGYEGTSAHLRIYKPQEGEAEMSESNFTDFCWLVEHELGHNKGYSHSDTYGGPAGRGLKHNGERPSWAKDLSPVKVKPPRVTKKITSEERIAERAAAVEEKLAYWQRKLKLAQTKLKKYRVKQRYYQTRQGLSKE